MSLSSVTSEPDELNVTWTDSNTYPDNSPVYTVTATPANGGTAVVSTSTTPTIAMTGLDAETTYTVSVVSTDDSGTSDPSNTISQETGENAPSALTATNISATGFTFGWTDSNPYASGETPAYNVTLNGSAATCTLSGTICVFTGLTPGTAYTVAVTLTANSVASSTTSMTVTTLSVANVNLSSVANVHAIVTNGTTVPDLGFDSGGRAYSYTQMPTSITTSGTPVSLGAANGADAVSSATVTLPYGIYSTMTLLGAAANGNQTAQSFTVTYTDGTTTTFTQGLSDWCTGASQTGETVAIQMAYRVLADGSTSTACTAYVYSYQFTLNASKVVQSLTLPSNRNVVILGIALAGDGIPVEISSVGNVNAMYADGVSFTTGGMDGLSGGPGNAYSSTLLGTYLTWNASTFPFAASGTLNGVRNTSVTLPYGEYSTMNVLATGIAGNQTSQTFVVTYTDASTQTYTQSFSDWYTSQSYTGESIASAMAYRNESTGTADDRTFNLYGYNLSLNAAKAVQSIQLPSTSDVIVLGMSLLGQSGSAPVVTNLSASYSGVGSTTLTWTAPGGLPAGATVTYNLSWDTGSLTGLTSTSYTLTAAQMTTAHVYTFTVTPVVNSITGTSSSISYAGGNINSPQNFTVTGTTSSTVSLSWSAITGDSDPTSDIEYFIYNVTGGAFTELATVAGTSTSTTITGLSSATSYEFLIIAGDTLMGQTGNPSTLTSTTADGVPGVPTSLSSTEAEKVENGLEYIDAEFSWSAPTNNGGSTITGYQITYQSPSYPYSMVTKTLGNVTSFSTGYSTNATTLGATIAAINAVGTGPSASFP